MDPNNLDPKMKATYDKVMGTPTPPPQPVAPVMPTPMPTTPIAPATGPVIPTDMPQATMPATPAYTSDNLSFQAAIQAPAAGVPAAAPNAQKMAKGSSSAGLKILYIVASVVFFVVYTFVWIKIFNLPLPF